MRVLIITLVLLLAASLAYAEQLTLHVEVIHDDKRAVTCWVYSGYPQKGGISCLPDSQLQAQGKPAGEHRQEPEPAGVSRRDIPSLAGDEPQGGPTPALTPAPRQHDERFQL